MIWSISRRVYLEGPSSAPLWPSQFLEWCKKISLLVQFLFWGRTRNRIMPNPESKADGERQEPVFSAKICQIRQHAVSLISFTNYQLKCSAWTHMGCQFFRNLSNSQFLSLCIFFFFSCFRGLRMSWQLVVFNRLISSLKSHMSLVNKLQSHHIINLHSFQYFISFFGIF